MKNTKQKKFKTAQFMLNNKKVATYQNSIIQYFKKTTLTKKAFKNLYQQYNIFKNQLRFLYKTF